MVKRGIISVFYSNNALVNLGSMSSREELGFENFIDNIVRKFLKIENPSVGDIDEVFEKLKRKAKTATRVRYLDIIGHHSKKACSDVLLSDENKKKHAWKKHDEVDGAIKKRRSQLTTTEKSFKVKFAGFEVEKREKKQPPS